MVCFFKSFCFFFFLIVPRTPRSTLFPYTTLFRSYTAHWTPFLFLAAVLALVVTGRQPQGRAGQRAALKTVRSEEHTSELQSHSDIVCRLLLEKKNVCQSQPVRVGSLIAPAIRCRI